MGALDIISSHWLQSGDRCHLAKWAQLIQAHRRLLVILNNFHDVVFQQFLFSVNEISGLARAPFSPDRVLLLLRTGQGGAKSCLSGFTSIEIFVLVLFCAANECWPVRLAAGTAWGVYQCLPVQPVHRCTNHSLGLSREEGFLQEVCRIKPTAFFPQREKTIVCIHSFSTDNRDTWRDVRMVYGLLYQSSQ